MRLLPLKGDADAAPAAFTFIDLFAGIERLQDLAVDRELHPVGEGGLRGLQRWISSGLVVGDDQPVGKHGHAVDPARDCPQFPFEPHGPHDRNFGAAAVVKQRAKHLVFQNGHDGGDQSLALLWRPEPGGTFCITLGCLPPLIGRNGGEVLQHAVNQTAFLECYSRFFRGGE